MKGKARGRGREAWEGEFERARTDDNSFHSLSALSSEQQETKGETQGVDFEEWPSPRQSLNEIKV